MDMTIEAAQAPARPGLRSAFLPLLILALAMASGFTMMNSFSMVQEGAKAELGLSDAVLGLIQGASAAVPLVLFSIPIGILVDRRNRVRLLIALALVWTFGTLLTAFSSQASMLFAARMMTGIGTTGALTAALSLTADHCSAEDRGGALLIVTLGKCMGQAGAFALTGWLLGVFMAHGLPPIGSLAPWRSTHVALAAISFALVLPLFALREPPRHEVEAGRDAPFRVVAGELWARRGFLVPLFIGQTSVVMADAAAGIWAAPVLSRSYGLQPAEFAGWMGSIVLLTGFAGSILGGIAANIGQRTGRRGGILIGAIAAAALGIPAALFPVMPSIPGFAILLGLLILCGTITGLITSVALTVLIPNELRGLCVGAFIAIAGLIGFGLAPSLVSVVSTLLGGEAKLGQALAIVGIAVSAISLGAFAIAMRKAPRGISAEPIG